MGGVLGGGGVLQAGMMEPCCRQDGATLQARGDGAVQQAGRMVARCCRQGQSDAAGRGGGAMLQAGRGHAAGKG